MALILCCAAPAGLLTLAAQGSARYDQQLRPQFHFSPLDTFTNDPNGLVHYKGVYHLFYQQRIFTGATGMSCCDWGHAVSADLVNWEQRPVAIHRVPASESTPGEAIFSGSAVVDWGNTSGFGTADNPPLVAVYTASRRGSQTQKLAYSVDEGTTWQVYAGNPVLDIQSGNFRDPKVFWYEPLKRWTMVIYESRGTQFYTSPNLKEWTYQSTFGTGFECPDFFPLALDGDATRQKWVLFEANGEYWVGDFDGTRFTPDGTTPRDRMDYGTNYYAAQTFSDTPGRRILVSWISTGFRRNGIWTELPWMGAMTVARQLNLRTIDGRPQIVLQPVQELEGLRTSGVTVRRVTIAAESSVPLAPGVQGSELDIEVTIEPGTSSESGLRVLAGHGLYTTIGYDARTNEVFIDRARAGRQDGLGGNGASGRVALPREALGKPVNLRILVDRSTLEVYADGGSRVLTANVLPLVNSVMTDGASVGDTRLLVQATTGFRGGQTLRLGADANGPRPGMQEATIANVDADSLTLSAPLTAAWAAGTPVSTAPLLGVEAFASGGTATVSSGRVWTMRSIWDKR